MALSTKSLAGPGYIILNTLRVMNIIALFSVVAASLVMLVKTVMISQFFFFDGVSHVITASIATFLVISEFSLFPNYFARSWPLLSPSHGFVALGSAMLILGVNILGNLNKQATSQKSLGLAFWRIVIGSGIIVMILGVFNILASYIFRARARGVNARQIRAEGAVALNRTNQFHSNSNKAYSFSTASRPSTSHEAKTPKNMQTSTITPTTTGEPPRTPPRKSAMFNPKRFTSMFSKTPDNKPILPSYNAATSPAASSKYSERPDTVWPNAAHHGGRELEISGPLNINPQFAHLVRPDSCHHPSRRGA